MGAIVAHLKRRGSGKGCAYQCNADDDREPEIAGGQARSFSGYRHTPNNAALRQDGDPLGESFAEKRLCESRSRCHER